MRTRGIEIPTQTIVIDYDPAWPGEFDALSRLLLTALGPLAVAVHHVGSTSVPGMPSKAVLDIDIELRSREALPDAIGALSHLGYFYQGEKGITDRHAFGRDSADVPFCDPERKWMEHHLYVCPADSPELRRHLLFRDRLRADPDLHARYAAIKADALSIAGGVRARYVEEKARLGQAFFEEVLGEYEPASGPDASAMTPK